MSRRATVWSAIIGGVIVIASLAAAFGRGGDE
jgi:hypothetical protein